MSSPAQQSTTQTEFLKLVGGSIKIPVRSVPNTKGSIVRFLSPGNIIEVKVINSKGYYRLADDTVNDNNC